MTTIIVNDEIITGSQLETIRTYYTNILGNVEDQRFQDLLISSVLYSQAFRKTGKTAPLKKIDHWIEAHQPFFPKGVDPEELKTIAKRNVEANLYVKEMHKKIHPTDEQLKEHKKRLIQRLQDGKLIFVRRIFQRVLGANPADAMVQLLGIRDQIKTPEDFNQFYVFSYLENKNDIQGNPYLAPTLAIDRELPDSLSSDMKEMLFSLKPGELSDIYDDGGQWIWFADIMPVDDAAQLLQGTYLEKDLFHYLVEKQAKETLNQFRGDSKIEIK